MNMIYNIVTIIVSMVIIIIIITMLFPGAVMMFDLAAPARGYTRGTEGCREM